MLDSDGVALVRERHRLEELDQVVLGERLQLGPEKFGIFFQTDLSEDQVAEPLLQVHTQSVDFAHDRVCAVQPVLEVQTNVLSVQNQFEELLEGQLLLLNDETELLHLK